MNETFRLELDWQIRIADPFRRVAPPVMASQRDKVTGTQLLCRYYGPRVRFRISERHHSLCGRGITRVR